MRILIDSLEAEGKLKKIEAQDFRLREARIQGYEESERQFALETLQYEIHQKIERVETFDQMMQVQDLRDKKKSKKRHG